MERRRIPRTDLEVSALCLGTMTFGTPVGEAEAIGIVHRALDLGVNFIDTANSYEGYSRQPGSAGGVAEEILGKALSGRREAAVVATKVGMKIGPDPGDEGLSRLHVLRECDRSLRRLKADRIDLYYMHRPDPRTPLEESIAAFAELIQAGKVRYWGLSNFDAGQVRQVLQLCESRGWPRPVALQPAYSLLRRQADEELLPLCQQEGIGVVPYRVLEGGMLTGKYRPGTPLPADSRAAERPEWVPLLRDQAMLQELQKVWAQAEAQGMDLFVYTLRQTLAVPGIASLIIGIRRPGQLEAAVVALG